MTPAETAAILRKFAQCLRADKYLWGASLPGVSAEVVAAVESAIEIIDRLEAAEKMERQEYAVEGAAMADDDYPDYDDADREACKFCGGDGGDPGNDRVLPCPECNWEGWVPWE